MMSWDNIEKDHLENRILELNQELNTLRLAWTEFKYSQANGGDLKRDTGRINRIFETSESRLKAKQNVPVAAL